MDFRKDINGLRAVAVLPVLFFHAGWSLFPGGYLGVDVFFVISGFLITSLIIRDLDDGIFSIWSFYNRRARRILPALVLTCLITTILSFVFMLPYDLKNYGQSLVATLISANNILLYLTSGYWSLASEFKPLYHTWSLAVEEHYYLIIPALLFAIHAFTKIRLKITLLVLSTLLLSSFAASFLSRDGEFNFLIFTHRMWEMLSGSLAAILLSRKKISENNSLTWIGLILIVLCYLFPNAISTNQAIRNLPPVIGTLLIIIFSTDCNFLSKMASTKPVFLIGSSSYSIYLLHMPILAFLRLASKNKPGVALQVLFVLCSLPLAYISWKYFEKKFRDQNTISNRVFYSIISTTTLILICGGLFLHKSYGMQHYFPKFGYGINPQRYADIPYSMGKNEFSDSGKKHLLIVGNSFARDFANMMIENQINKTHEIVYLYDFFSDSEKSKKLLASADLTIAVSSYGIGGMIDPDMVKRSSKLVHDFLDCHSNGNFLLIGTKNFGWNNNFVKSLTDQELIGCKVRINDSTLMANNIEKSIWKDHYVDLIGSLSDDGVNAPLFTPEGKFISFDTEHLTRDGAIYIGRVLLEKSILVRYLSK